MCVEFGYYRSNTAGLSPRRKRSKLVYDRFLQVRSPEHRLPDIKDIHSIFGHGERLENPPLPVVVPEEFALKQALASPIRRAEKRGAAPVL